MFIKPFSISEYGKAVKKYECRLCVKRQTSGPVPGASFSHEIQSISIHAKESHKLFSRVRS